VRTTLKLERKRVIQKLSIIFLVLFLFTACTFSGGKKISQDQLSVVKEGETTYDQLVAKFGSPTEEVEESDGTREVIYQYDEARNDAIGYVPYVGLFMGGMETKLHRVTFTLDQNNIIQKFYVRKSEQRVDQGF